MEPQDNKDFLIEYVKDFGKFVTRLYGDWFKGLEEIDQITKMIKYQEAK